MLKTLIVAAALSLGMAATAHAGCYDYADSEAIESAPRAEICYAGKCAETVVVVICSSSDNGLVIYANGWQLWWNAPASGSMNITASLADKVLTADELTQFQCKAIDAEACL